MQTSLLVALRYEDVFALITNLRQRVFAGVIHGGRVSQRRRIEVLHLVETEAVFFQPQRQVHHIFITRTGVCGDEIRDQILLFACLFRVGVEQLFKAVIATHARLHHLRQWPFFGMFRRNLQITTDVMGRQLFDVARIFYGDVIAHAGGDQDLFNAFQIAGTAIEIDRRLVVSVHMRTNIRIHTRQAAAGLLGAWRFAAQHIHVGRWPAEIGNHARKARNGIADRFNLINDRVFRTALNNAPFMLGNRTERTAAKAATHNIDRETDHFVSRNTGITVSRMRHALVRQRKDAVHLFGRKRNGWRVDPHIAVAMFLHQRTSAAWVGFVVQNTRSMCVQHFIALHFLE